MKLSKASLSNKVLYKGGLTDWPQEEPQNVPRNVVICVRVRLDRKILASLLTVMSNPLTESPKNKTEHS